MRRPTFRRPLRSISGRPFDIKPAYYARDCAALLIDDLRPLLLLSLPTLRQLHRRLTRIIRYLESQEGR